MMILWHFLYALSVFAMGCLAEEINCDYDAYLEDFGKKYGRDEKEARRIVFMKNCEELKDIEKKANGRFHVALS